MSFPLQPIRAAAALARNNVDGYGLTRINP